MFSRDVEDAYINNVAAADQSALYRNRWRPLAAIAVIMIAFLTWAALFEVEEVTRGTGRVIPSSQIQVVQSLEGGIVRGIQVSEGDTVAAGDVLMQIDATTFLAEEGELRERETALLAERARRQAEATLGETVVYAPEFAAANPLATAAEVEVFVSLRAQLQTELSVLDKNLSQRRGELSELLAQQEMRSAMIVPLAEEQALIADLASRNAVPRVELLRLNSRLAELEGERAVGEATIERLEAAIEQAETEIEAARSAYVLSARQRLARIQVELAVIQEALKAAEDRVNRTQLRAPVNGTVNLLYVTTDGAVVQPGAPVAEIVPADDGLLIEADILPADVAFIAPGDRAAVKITAYDYLIYGALEGRVERIGADTITNADGQAFFRVIVATEKNFVGSEADPLAISPGMIAALDIQTGQKTVLDFLLTPIRRAQAEALREN